MNVLSFLSLLLATGCSSDLESGHKLGEFEAFTEAVENLATNHVVAVEAATSIEAVDVLEIEYATNWAFFSDELNTIQDELDKCDIADGMHSQMDGTRAAINAMMGEMLAHADAHDDHTDLSECIATEEPHYTTMIAAVEDCLDAHEAMHDSVSCAEGHMEGM